MSYEYQIVGLDADSRRINTFILTLMNLPGVGARTIQRLLKEKRQTIKNASVLNEKLALSLNVNAITKALSHTPATASEERVEYFQILWEKLEDDADRIIDQVNKKNISILNPYMDTYPKRLLLNKKFPPILFCKGDVSVLNEEKSVAIIGTREPTDFGKRMGYRLAKLLAEEGYVVVSGLAKGCDTVGHEGALDARGKTIAVLPTPIDAPVYPKQNQALADRIVANGGLLVSEYAPGMKLYDRQLATNLVARDEWQPGLSDGVIAIETSVDGGTNHAMKHAINTDTPIAVFDYSSRKNEDFYGDERFGGNIEYLKKGAYPIFEASTIEDFKKAMQAYREKHVKKSDNEEAPSLFDNQHFFESV